MIARNRDWFALGVLVLPVLLISVDVTVLGFALPYLSEALQPTSAEQLWIVDIYSFLLAGLLVLMGSLGDRIGRRKLLLLGAAAFGIASILAAWSGSAALLIAARALLGVGGATLMPSTLSLIRSIFTEPNRRRIAIGVWSAGFSGGMAIGPVIGGWLLEHFWWGSVFLVNVPVMALLLVLGPILLPEARDPNPGRFDALSALLSLATTLPVVYGIKTIATHGLTIDAGLGILAGIGLGVLFVSRQRKLTDPMIDIGLFAERVFSASIVTNLIAVFAMVGLMLLLPQYLQLVLGMSPIVAGLWMLPATLSGVIGALAGARLATTFPPARIVGCGLLAGAVGFLLLSQLSAGSGLAVLVIGFTLIGCGLAVSETLTNDLIISVAPAERAGAASAISETAFELGGALGTAVIGSVATAVYRSGLGAPQGVPADSVDAALETLGAAVHTADQLPNPAGHSLLAAAREAFVNGMTVTAIIGGVLLVYTAVQAMVLLRKKRPIGTTVEA